MNKTFHEFFIYNEYGTLIHYTDFLTEKNDFINRMQDEKQFRNRMFPKKQNNLRSSKNTL